VSPKYPEKTPGAKWNRRDAARLTEFLQHGLLQGSYIPTAEIRQLHDLTRNRARAVQEAGRIQNRIYKVTLEEVPVAAQAPGAA
jgi:hypothetical protein